MRAARIFAGSLAALVLAGCTSMRVQSDHDREAPLTEFQTYEWVEPAASGADSGLGFDSPLMARRIESSVHARLAESGFEQSASGTPDFLISFRMVAQEEVRELGSYGPYGHGGHGHGSRHGRHGGHGGHGHGGHGTTHSQEMVRCVLVLDIWDSGSGRLVWRGWARWLLDANPSPEKVTKHLQRAVDRILNEFPPDEARAGAGSAEEGVGSVATATRRPGRPARRASDSTPRPAHGIRAAPRPSPRGRASGAPALPGRAGGPARTP